MKSVTIAPISNGVKSKIKISILLAMVALLTGVSNSYSTLSLDRIMGIINADRESQGLHELALNPTLNLAALAKAHDMISNHYFAHTSPEGVAPWYWIKTLGYNYSYAGENLAIGYQDAGDLVDSWMQSPAHRANILSPNYEDMGLAVIKSQNSTLVVQMFGTPHKLSQK
jgi:uncharacterized protein YkwD